MDREEEYLIPSAKGYRPRCFFDININNVSVGRIILELFADICPKTCENFRALCTGEKGDGKTTLKPLHYKGTVFHRIVAGFIIQGGDFSAGDGTGGESIYGGTFKDESFELEHDQPYLLSMANRGPNTNGSQFFITLAPAPHLDKVHCVFGRVLYGQEIVRDIENQKVNSNHSPYAEIRVTHCGELVKKSKQNQLTKIKKISRKASSSSSSSSSDEESDRDEKKKAKANKKSKAKRSGVEEHQKIEEKETIHNPHIPDVPRQSFLLRRSRTPSPVRERNKGRRNRQDLVLHERVNMVSKSGKKLRGRGIMRYRTPSPEQSDESGKEYKRYHRSNHARRSRSRDQLMRSPHRGRYSRSSPLRKRRDYSISPIRKPSKKVTNEAEDNKNIEQEENLETRDNKNGTTKEAANPEQSLEKKMSPTNGRNRSRSHDHRRRSHSRERRRSRSRDRKRWSRSRDRHRKSRSRSRDRRRRSRSRSRDRRRRSRSHDKRRRSYSRSGRRSPRRSSRDRAGKFERHRDKSSSDESIERKPSVSNIGEQKPSYKERINMLLEKKNAEARLVEEQNALAAKEPDISCPNPVAYSPNEKLPTKDFATGMLGQPELYDDSIIKENDTKENMATEEEVDLYAELDKPFLDGQPNSQPEEENEKPIDADAEHAAEQRIKLLQQEIDDHKRAKMATNTDVEKTSKRSRKKRTSKANDKSDSEIEVLENKKKKKKNKKRKRYLSEQSPQSDHSDDFGGSESDAQSVDSITEADRDRKSEKKRKLANNIRKKKKSRNDEHLSGSDVLPSAQDEEPSPPRKSRKKHRKDASFVQDHSESPSDEAPVKKKKSKSKKRGKM